jgi:DNA ligase-associated metallophosphoesterase
MSEGALTTLEADAADRISFGGASFVPLVSGGLFWPDENALLVADLHLVKLASYAKRGQLLPPYDTAMTLRRLDADLERTGARELIALGDNFHRDDGPLDLLEADRERLARMAERVKFTWVTGNHDENPVGFAHHGVQVMRRGLTLTHHPVRGGLTIAGHLHPAAHIAINGASTRRRCFVHDGTVMVLPAYGSSTGAMNILGPAFRGVFDRARLDVRMIGRDRVYPVSPKRLITGWDG